MPDITIKIEKQDNVLPVYGKSYCKRNLDYYKKFYLLFPDPQKVNTCVHNLEKFILELGRGFAFVERQQHA